MAQENSVNKSHFYSDVAKRLARQVKFPVSNENENQHAISPLTMDEKSRRTIQLNCLYDMFRDKIEEDVIYIIYLENEAKIDTTIDQLMSVAACSFTGHYFGDNQAEASGLVAIADLQKQSAISSSKGSRQTLIDDPRIDSEGFITYNAQRNNRLRNKQRKNSPCPTSNCSTLGDQTKASYPSTSQDQNDDKFSTTTTTTSTTDCNIHTNANGDYDEIEDSVGYETDSIEGIDRKIQSIQLSIEHLLEEKNASHEKASHYLSKKMYPVTSYYSNLATDIRRMIEAKTHQLVEILLKKSTDSKTIDLHGLNPIQATLVIKELLKTRQDKLMIDKQGETCVDIITGWGKHSISPNGQKIRPTIVKLLKDEGYEFCHINKGALRVTIRR